MSHLSPQLVLIASLAEITPAERMCNYEHWPVRGKILTKLTQPVAWIRLLDFWNTKHEDP